MLYPELEAKLINAHHAFETSAAENLIDSGEKYLELLEEYISKLHSPPGRYAQPASPSASKAVADLRELIQSSIDQSEKERARVDALLNSLEEMTVGEAVETFNRLNYRGLNSWEVRINEITDDRNIHHMSFQDAVDAASLLLCEEYVALRTSPM
jgi:hypothetical protein